MRNEEARDEMAQEFADEVWKPNHFPMSVGGNLLDLIEEEWQGVHATEEAYEDLANDYYEGMAEMVLRIANVLLDQIRERCAKQPGMADVARRVQDMKVHIHKEA